MFICDNLIIYICSFLDIKTMIKFLLFYPINKVEKNVITKTCISSKMNLTDVYLNNYYESLLYFQNKYSYKCYKCNKNLNKNYNMVICSCIIDKLNLENKVYAKYHPECLLDNYKKTSEKLYTTNCENCNKTRICIKCNIYS